MDGLSINKYIVAWPGSKCEMRMIIFVCDYLTLYLLQQNACLSGLMPREQGAHFPLPFFIFFCSALCESGLDSRTFQNLFPFSQTEIK